MKEIKINLYSFDELSEGAQKNVIEHERSSIVEFGCELLNDDYSGTLKAFCELFGISHQTHSHYWSWFVTWDFKYQQFPDMACDDKDVADKYVLRFLNRHYYDMLHRKTIYGKHKYDENGKFIGCKKFTSRCEWVDDGCPLTGLYCDYDILEPIRKYLKKPDSSTLGELIDDCFSNFVKSWNEEYEYLHTDEYARQELTESGNYDDALYYADGTKYTGPVSESAA